MHDPAPITINGLNNIAKALGFSPEFVRASLLEQPDFPVKIVGRRLITTRRRLEEWADNLVKPPLN